jgi:phospholipid/cholesterol/gamma-HCH transport system ATP-binding protein
MSSSRDSASSSGLEARTLAPAAGPEPGTPLIVYRGIYKSFDTKKVLNNINLKVYEGETLVILGRSGSGKTVMVSMLVGLTRPNQGTVTIGGVDITKLNSEAEWQELRLKTGYLFQGSALFDSMTVGENVAFPMVYHADYGPEEIERRVKEKLAQVGLEGVENLEPSALSGGMQRRAALARSLALDPQIIIYDEPTSGLDPLTGDEIGHLIRRLQKTLKVTSMVVTHDLRLTQLVADRLALLYEGDVVFLGTIDELAGATHPEVHRFLASTPLEEKMG